MNLKQMWRPDTSRCVPLSPRSIHRKAPEVTNGQVCVLEDSHGAAGTVYTLIQVRLESVLTRIVDLVGVY